MSERDAERAEERERVLLGSCHESVCKSEEFSECFQLSALRFGSRTDEDFGPQCVASKPRERERERTAQIPLILNAERNKHQCVVLLSIPSSADLLNYRSLLKDEIRNMTEYHSSSIGQSHRTKTEIYI